MTKTPCQEEPLEIRALNMSCECPVPCRDLVYNPTISYSSLSRQMLYELLHNKDRIASIKDDYNYAQEVHQRVSESVRCTPGTCRYPLIHVLYRVHLLF